MKAVQFYKQPDDGACDDDGASMDRGWYWVATKVDEWGTDTGVPYGLSTGPFRTKREVERAYRRNPVPREGENVFRVGPPCPPLPAARQEETGTRAAR